MLRIRPHWGYAIMSSMVVMRESYFRMPDGAIHMRLYIGTHVFYEAPSQLPFVQWSPPELPWNTVHEPITALMKEGPKAMVLL